MTHEMTKEKLDVEELRFKAEQEENSKHLKTEEEDLQEAGQESLLSQQQLIIIFVLDKFMKKLSR